MPILFHRHFSLGTIIYGVLVAGLVVLLGAYVLFQARYVIDGPTITLDAELSTLQHGPTVELLGQAKNIISLSLNGRTIYTNNDGHFDETLVIPLGYTIVTLVAKGRYGRTYVLERTLVRVEDDAEVVTKKVTHQPYHGI